MVQAGTQGIYAEVAERDNAGEWGGSSRWVGGCVAPALDTRAHIRMHAYVHIYTRVVRQTSNKSFNKFCGSGGGADGGGGGASGGNDKL